VRRGERREGLFFGLLNLGEKIAAGTALLCTGVLLDLFVGLVPGRAPTGPSLSRIGVVYGVVPAVVLLGSAASLSGYRLDRRAVTEIQARLGRKDTTVVAA